MRTKALLLTAALSAVAIGTAVAQTVYSVNAVGYIRMDVNPGFTIIANQLDSGNNTLASLIPTAPPNTSVYKFDPATGIYSIANYLVIPNVFEGWQPASLENMTLNPGEAVFIRNQSAEAFSVTFVGEVPQGQLTQALPVGFSLQSSQVPQAGLVSTDLGLPVGNGDQVYKFDNATGIYSIYNYLVIPNVFEGWQPAEPTVAVGEGFFLKKAAAGTWTREFSVNQ